tara:strand:- start:52 stop:210 length:159 start_codon:yes stop_codon:yes gene_type:complete
MNKLNYFNSGRYNRKLEQSYLYDKKKKELKHGRQKENNTQERCEEKKTATEL